MDFWTEHRLKSIDKMLNPRSIAVVGASPKGGYGGRLLNAVLKAKDRINDLSRQSELRRDQGVRAYPSITDSARSAGPRRRRRALYARARRAEGVRATRKRARASSFPPASPSAAPMPGSICSRPSRRSPGNRACTSPAPTASARQRARQHLGDRVLAHARRADRAHRARLPERRHRFRAFPAARGRQRHRS